MHSEDILSQRRIAVAAHLCPRSVPERTRTALAALGYAFVEPGCEAASPLDRPALRIVDDRLLAEIPNPVEDPETPIILLTARRSAACADPRVVGCAGRPAQLEELFPILQKALKGTPRRAPRTRVSLSARCFHADRRWLGAIVELSTAGCQVEGQEWKEQENLRIGSRLNLHFAVPGPDGSRRATPLSVRAEIKELSSDRAGLEFCEPNDAVRKRVADYVAARLAG